jgi:hypothetical protein
LHYPFKDQRISDVLTRYTFCRSYPNKGSWRSESPRSGITRPFSPKAREKSGRFHEALAILAKTLETLTEPGVGFYSSELYRL